MVTIISVLESILVQKITRVKVIITHQKIIIYAPKTAQNLEKKPQKIKKIYLVVNFFFFNLLIIMFHFLHCFSAHIIKLTLKGNRFFIASFTPTPAIVIFPLSSAHYNL